MKRFHISVGVEYDIEIDDSEGEVTKEMVQENLYARAWQNGEVAVKRFLDGHAKRDPYPFIRADEVIDHD